MDSVFFWCSLLAASVVAGVAITALIIRFIPWLEKRDNHKQKEEVLKEARRQKDRILESSALQLNEHISLMEEELELTLFQIKETKSIEEGDLDAQEALLNSETKRVEKIEGQLVEKQEQVSQLTEQLDEKKKEYNEIFIRRFKGLEEKTKVSGEETKIQLIKQITNERQLECQKVLKLLYEDLDSSSRKSAQRMLERIHSRYAPNFVWPKNTNMVEVSEKNQRNFAQLVAEKETLLEKLSEISGVQIQVVERGQNEGREGQIPLIKVGGGFGVFREATRLALSDFVEKGQRGIDQLIRSYEINKNRLNNEAVELGKKAVTQLGLSGIHPRIQYLVGSLNWRTSYRQNQWYHTVEVAVLAGVIAREMGLNADDAKRVGLLHDIGKAIDYRIEGSHAVISGDYADRYGEKRYICDTVMSHHADLLVETPLAYVLRAADTLSGARPGARVNLEEGYQIRIEGILESIHSFEGIADVAIMNGGREVHIQVNNSQISEAGVEVLTKGIVEKIENNVSYPGQIKVLVSRTFEAVTVA